jgi:hypothetical protein
VYVDECRVEWVDNADILDLLESRPLGLFRYIEHLVLHCSQLYDLSLCTVAQVVHLSANCAHMAAAAACRAQLCYGSRHTQETAVQRFATATAVLVCFTLACIVWLVVHTCVH